MSAWKIVDWGGKVAEYNWKWGRKGEWQWLSAIMWEALNEKTEGTKRGSSLSVLSHIWMFPVMWPVWLLKVYKYSRSNQAKERSSKGLQCQLGRTCRARRSWREGAGRCYLCSCCSAVCTPGKLATAGGSLWRAFGCTLSSCSHGLKMRSVIGNFIQLLTAFPKATQLPKRKNVALVGRTRPAWNRQM